MDRLFAAWLACLISMACLGCNSLSSNTRESLLRTAREQDHYFPDGQHVKLTRFAYIGDVVIQGHQIHVVYASSVIADMLAPRGNSWLYFINGSKSLLERFPINGEPLWCDNSRIYFFGSQNDGDTQGNALELADGLKNAKYVYIPSAGSWQPDPANHSQ